MYVANIALNERRQFNVGLTSKLFQEKSLRKDYISASTNVKEMERLTRLEWGQEDQEMSQGKEKEEQPRWRREELYKVTLLVESGLDETLDT